MAPRPPPELVRHGECHGKTGRPGDGLGIAARRRFVVERNLDQDLLGFGTRGTARNRWSGRSRTGQIVPESNDRRMKWPADVRLSEEAVRGEISPPGDDRSDCYL
jgi:hypothetical protein